MLPYYENNSLPVSTGCVGEGVGAAVAKDADDAGGKVEYEMLK